MTEVKKQKKMKFKFENLIIWQKAIDYGEEIFQLSRQFPKEEIYNLTSQIRRAVDSIALNISEGSIGHQIWNKKGLLEWQSVLWLKW